MLISTKGRYALRMVIALAKLEKEKKAPVSLKDIAEAECVSMKYLEQLARCLSSKCIITSSRGKYGGYRLSDQPKNILAGDVLRAAEGSTAPVSCLEGGTPALGKTCAPPYRSGAGLMPLSKNTLTALPLPIC